MPQGMQRWIIFALLASVLAGAGIHYYEKHTANHAVEQGY